MTAWFTETDLGFQPPQTILYQLIISALVMGFTGPRSIIRAAILPVLAALVYVNVFYAAYHMRPRWAGGFGSTSFALLQQYVDIALISRLNYECSSSRPGTSDAQRVFDRFWYGWKILWSWRHLNTEYEVPNAPRFSDKEPRSFSEHKWPFVFRRAATAVVCYVLVDTIEHMPQDPEAISLFQPHNVPLFRRWREVKAEDLKLRFIAFAIFTFTFYNIIQCYYTAASAVAVATGLSRPEDWRPCFGPFLDAFLLLVVSNIYTAILLLSALHLTLTFY